MKIVVEPERLVFLVSNALLYKNTPVIDNAVLYLTDKGIVIKDCSLQVLAMYSIFPKHYFLEYDNSGLDKLVVTKSLFNILKSGFKSSEQIILTFKDNKIILKGKTATYKEPMPEPAELEFPLTFKKSKEGYLFPEGFEPSVIAVVRTEEFGDIQKADFYKFDFEDNTFKITIEDVGSYTKIIKPIKVVKGAKLSIKADGDFVRRILSNMTGEIVIAFNTDMIVFQKISKEYVQIFVLTVMIEHEIEPEAETKTEAKTGEDEAIKSELEQIGDVEDLGSEIDAFLEGE